MKMKVAVVGLGYVGTPLLVRLAKTSINCIGYDKSLKRIYELRNNIDYTNEIQTKNLPLLKKIVSSDEKILTDCDIFIITVPTPIDDKNRPDINLVIHATKTVAKYIKKKSIFILESTVYPGLTEEICLPILEKISNLKCCYNNETDGFHLGYSPERINPGDKKHTLENTTKIISSSSSYSLKKLKYLYNKVTNNNLHICKNIKTAEAAKIIENIQRDLNISLMNELHKLFTKMNINTYDVLDAAKTKWNFHDFTPGLVGGHCISVDPYYLTFKAKKLGFKTNVILAGRKTNDSMPSFYADQIHLNLSNKQIKPKNCKILICGVAFKKNVPDIRNSKSIILSKILIKLGYQVQIYDPVVPKKDWLEKNINFKNTLDNNKFNCIVMSVDHDAFKKNGIEYFQKYLLDKNSIVIDLKNMFQS